MKIAVVLGTRPEIIKMSPVIRALQALDVRHSALDEAPETHKSLIINHKSPVSPSPETSHVERPTSNSSSPQPETDSSPVILERSEGSQGEGTRIS